MSDVLFEREQDMRAVGITMSAWEYRMRWYGEDEPTARPALQRSEKNPPPLADGIGSGYNND